MKNKLELIANIISDVFNAYLALGLSFSLIILFDQDKIVNPYLIIFISLFLLIFNVALLRKLNIISDWEISNKLERPRFALSAMIPYTLIFIIALSNKSSLFISISLIVMFFNIVLGIISRFWKISGHMLYLSLLAVICFAILHNVYIVLFWIIVLPCVAWSRVYLKRHTVAQVVMGTIFGLLIPLLFI